MLKGMPLTPLMFPGPSEPKVKKSERSDYAQKSLTNLNEDHTIYLGRGRMSTIEYPIL